MMRPVMTKEEGLALIDEIKELDYLGITSEKSRESEYKEALQTGEALELVKVIKTISKRKEVRIAEGKKITATDEKYYRLAEERLYGELAVVLGVKKEDMPEFLRERIQQS